MTVLRAACVQLTAGSDIQANLATGAGLVREAAAAGARLIALPENCSAMADGPDAVRARAFPEAEHPALAHYAALARELGVHLLLGSIWARLADDQRLANRSLLLAPDGAIVARYDKIHMFDAQVGDGEAYRESANFRPGAAAVIGQMPWGVVGLTICYDVRFPYLYRALAQAGATLLTVPAAFTVPTGQAHWHVLLRARAIETGCFVLAPAQCGTHSTGRQTYGHSLIVAPWGEVLADGGPQPGVIIADLDLDQVEQARGRVASIRHDRPFVLEDRRS